MEMQILVPLVLGVFGACAYLVMRAMGQKVVPATCRVRR